MNSSIKARLASLQAIAAQKQEGVAIDRRARGVR